MEDTFLQVLKQVPALSVLAWVVWKFLKHLEAAGALQAAMLEKRDGILKDMHREHLDAREQSRLAIERCNGVIEKCLEQMGAAAETSGRVAEVGERTVKLLEDIYRGDAPSGSRG